jgi:cytochrome oxidase assembly protein ShyY1
MELGKAPPPRPGAIVQNLDAAGFAQAQRPAHAAVLVEQTSRTGAPAGGLVRDWPAPAVGRRPHRGYAFQWYALAAMAFLIFCDNRISKWKKTSWLNPQDDQSGNGPAAASAAAGSCLRW